MFESARTREICSMQLRLLVTTEMPNSRQEPRSALMREVRLVASPSIHNERMRCILCKVCCSIDLILTGRILSQRAASNKAQASATSVYCVIFTSTAALMYAAENKLISILIVFKECAQYEPSHKLAVRA